MPVENSEQKIVDVPMDIQEQFSKKDSFNQQHLNLQKHVSSTSSFKKQRQNETLYIPGPISLSESVQQANGTASENHMGSNFSMTFKHVLQKLYKLVKLDYKYNHHDTLQNKQDKPYQAFVMSGSGTLGFDLIATNLLVEKPYITKANKKALVLSTGYFSESIYKCLKLYFPDFKDGKNYNLINSEIDILYCPTGTAKFNLNELKYLLSSNNYQCITITHVDTSTGVLLDLYDLIPFIKKHSGNAFIAVDCVSSMGCELIDLNILEIDFLFTASQKALGCPPGLLVGFISKKVVDYLREEDINPHIKGYYTNLYKWLPIWESYEYYMDEDDYYMGEESNNNDSNHHEKPMYFATPPTQLIHALDVSLDEILDYGIDKRCQDFANVSDYIKSKVRDIFELELLNENDPSHAAHGLTCVLYRNVDALIKYCAKNFKIELAGPLIKHIKIKTSNKIEIEYFRIGHMSLHILNDFVNNNHVELDTFLSIMKKNIENVDLLENKTGYSSISLAETL